MTLLSPSVRRQFLFLSVSLAFCLILLVPVEILAQTPQLSLADLIIGLRSKKATVAARNKILADAVRQRGITFSLTPEIEKELTQTGAEKELIEAVRQKSQVIKTVVAPKPEPAAPIVPALDSTYYFRRANSFLNNGENDLAVVDYNKALELNQSDTWSYVNRGMAFYNKKNYELAILDFSRALEISPKEARIYFKRGDALEKKGKTETAVADYKKAVELDPDYADAKKAIERIKTEQEKQIAQAQTPPPAPIETEKPIETKKSASPVNLGSLNNLAIKLVVPTYPASERQRNIQGVVMVKVFLDEEGKVVSAEAFEGPAALRVYAEEAAKKSKFKPAVLKNAPVKATGIVAYNFKAK